MTLKKLSQFKFVDRGKGKDIVLLPGWAADYRIFDTLDIDFNYLLPVNFHPVNFEKSLISYIKESNIKSISLFGWSMGGFAAASFAGKYPELVDELILAGVRKRYPKENIIQIKRFLKRNKKAYLYKFYSRCFYKKDEWFRFKENLFEEYCQDFSLDYLLATLDYLGKSQINPQDLNKVKKIKIIHGECDNIVPIDEAAAIKEKLPQAEFKAIKNTGHIPFLGEDFRL